MFTNDGWMFIYVAFILPQYASIYVLDASIIYAYDARMTHVFKKFISHYRSNKKKNSPYFQCKVFLISELNFRKAKVTDDNYRNTT